MLPKKLNLCTPSWFKVSVLSSFHHSNILLLYFSVASLLPNWEHPACCRRSSLWTGTGQGRCRGYRGWECNCPLNRSVALKKWRHCCLCCCCSVPNVWGQVTRLQEETVSRADKFFVPRRCTLARGESRCICIVCKVLVILCWFALCGQKECLLERSWRCSTVAEFIAQVPSKW